MKIPEMTSIAPLALALGATSFEKHVAVETSEIKKMLILQLLINLVIG